MSGLRGKASILSAVRLVLRSSLNAAITDINTAFASDQNGIEGLAEIVLDDIPPEAINIRLDGTLLVEPCDAPLIRVTPGIASDFQRMGAYGGFRYTEANVWVYAKNAPPCDLDAHDHEEWLVLKTQGYLDAIACALSGNASNLPSSPGLQCLKSYGIEQYEEIGSDVRLVTTDDATTNGPLVLVGIYTIRTQQTSVN